MRINWVPNGISLIWNASSRNIGVKLVIEHQLYCEPCITQLLDVESKAQSRLFIVVCVLRISHVVPNLLLGIELDYFVIVVGVWREGLLLRDDYFDLGKKVELSLIVFFDITDCSQIWTGSHVSAFFKRAINIGKVFIESASSVAMCWPEVPRVLSVKVLLTTGDICEH